MKEFKIARSQGFLTKTEFENQFTHLSTGVNFGNYAVQGLQLSTYSKELTYHETIKVCRWFVKYDPIAGTVIERMSDMAITQLKNRKKSLRNVDQVDDITLAYYNTVANQLRPLLKQMALEYLIHGMAVPDYSLVKKRGNLSTEILGRSLYWFPDKLWCRNPENIILKKLPTGIDRSVYLKIPTEDINFIQNKGIRSDGIQDSEGYKYLVENFPEYVKLIKSGKTIIPLPDVKPLLRKPNSYEEYPTPYLQKAIKALQHKEFLKSMDRSIASRAIEAIRHVKVGNKDFPADDDAIEDVITNIRQNSSSGERVFNLFTNHTVEIVWIFPPIEALINEQKYAEPNADIFLGLGFPRVLTVGETLRSNSSDSSIASLGPKATFEDLRKSILDWVEYLYQVLAEKNGFKRIPEPYFAPIPTTDLTGLLQYAVDAMKSGSISKDDVAQLWNTDYETVADQIIYEQNLGVLGPEEIEKQNDTDNSKIQ